jgi:tetratricopeptide (TPR) repeat protein
VAETYFAHAFFLWNAFGGYQTDAAIRELLLAKQLNPNSCSADLPALLGHLGLDDAATRELQRALNIDPTSQSLKDLNLILPYMRADADAWFAARQNASIIFLRVEPWYYIRKGLLDDAQKAIDERMAKAPEDSHLQLQQSLLLAVRGRFSQAVARVPEIVAKIEPNSMSRHHSTYFAACVYALSGNSNEAVRWLKETANTGFPNYPLFERDPFLNRIRQTPEFIEFMSDQKAHWEKLRAEFGS